MKTAGCSKKHSQSGMTLGEVLAVTVVLIVLFLFLIPVFTGVSKKSPEVKALSNAKQIGLALRLYAEDNNGAYPSYLLKSGKPTATPVFDSNTAFAQLFPTYVTSEEIFYIPKSAWTPAPPDDVIDTPPLDTPVKTLARGENEWAYVIGLSDSSPPSTPLIADGFYNPRKHTYSTDETRKGGIWKGAYAIVVHSDNSGAIMKPDPATMTIIGPSGTDGTTGDIFTTANAANGWLTPANTVVNPK